MNSRYRSSHRRAQADYLTQKNPIYENPSLCPLCYPWTEIQTFFKRVLCGPLGGREVH